jgi:hypothetical protein
MRNATAERGNYLDTLGDSINNVSISAGNYLSQARNAAVSKSFSLMWFWSDLGVGERSGEGLDQKRFWEIDVMPRSRRTEGSGDVNTCCTG